MKPLLISNCESTGKKHLREHQACQRQGAASGFTVRGDFLPVTCHTERGVGAETSLWPQDGSNQPLWLTARGRLQIRRASDSSRERTWSNRGKEFLKCSSTRTEIMGLKNPSLSHLVANTLAACPGLPQITLGALRACPSKEHSWELSQKTMPQKHQPKRLYSATCKSYTQTQHRQWILTLLLLLTESQRVTCTQHRKKIGKIRRLEVLCPPHPALT